MNYCSFLSNKIRHTRSLSDLSSDVCSSDLVAASHFRQLIEQEVARCHTHVVRDASRLRIEAIQLKAHRDDGKIGRASCRERARRSERPGSAVEIRVEQRDDTTDRLISGVSD